MWENHKSGSMRGRGPQGPLLLYSTRSEHMPPHHQAVAKGWSADYLLDQIGRRVGGVLTDPVPSSNRTCGFPTSGSPTIVALY